MPSSHWEGTVLRYSEGIAAPLHNLCRMLFFIPLMMGFNDNFAAGGAEGALTE